MFETVDDKLRKLAKSIYWQNLYNASKSCNGITCFDNCKNFSGLQVRLLHWLSVYDMLETELARQEDSYLTRDVIDDDVRCDAYLIYRNKKHEHLWKKYRQDEKMSDVKKRHPKKHRSGKSQLINVDLRSE